MTSHRKKEGTPRRVASGSRLEALIQAVKRNPYFILFGALVALLGVAATVMDNFDSLVARFKESPTPVPLIRQSEHIFEGYSISLLLGRVLDKRLEAKFEAKPMLLKNPVYVEAEKIQREFGAIMLPRDGGLVFASNKQISEQEQSVFARTPMVQETTSWEWSFDRGVDEKDILLNSQWKVAFVKDSPQATIATRIANGTLNPGALVFTRTLSCKEAIERIRSLSHMTTERLFFRLASKGCAGLSFHEVARFGETACEGEGSWTTAIESPRVSLKVAAISNLNDKAMKVSVEYVEDDAPGIRPPGQRTAAQKQGETMLGDGTLVPGEAFIIPLQLTLSSAPLDYEEAEWSRQQTEVYAADELIPALRQQLASMSSITLVFQPEDGNSIARPQRYSIASQRLLSDYGFTPSVEEATPGIFGPSWTLQQVVVNGIETDAHVASSDRMYVTSVATVGSCPHLYAQFDSGTTTYLGKVLTGRDNEAIAGQDSKFVSAWPRNVIVAEKEPETTYLHDLTAICEQADGNVLTRRPLQPNGEALFPRILRRGETASYRFAPLSESTQCISTFVKARGYFVVDSKANPATVR